MFIKLWQLEIVYRSHLSNSILLPDLPLQARYLGVQLVDLVLQVLHQFPVTRAVSLQPLHSDQLPLDLLLLHLALS